MIRSYALSFSSLTYFTMRLVVLLESLSSKAFLGSFLQHFSSHLSVLEDLKAIGICLNVWAFEDRPSAHFNHYSSLLYD